MLFWLICALLTVAVTIVTLRPVLQREPPSGSATDAEDVGVYKDQLLEVDRDIARGLLSEEEGVAARLEISRRILAVDASAGAAVSSDLSDTTPSEKVERDQFFPNLIFYLSSAVLISASLGLYLAYGSPGYGGRPHAERARAPAAGAPVKELIARVEARLREAPNDGRGWDVLAPVYLKQGRNRDAARAFERAIAILGENRARLRGLAEAHLAASNGIVGPTVRDAYTKILAKEPNLIAPRFWLAVGKEQDGDITGAAAAYRSLLQLNVDGRPLPGPLRQLINERLAAVTGSKPPAALTETGKAPALPAGAGTGLSPAQQSAMIQRMVAGLAERLNAEGGTRKEWQRLIRAYTVLGRRADAEAAFAKARKQLTQDKAETRQLDEFAATIGLRPKVR